RMSSIQIGNKIPVAGHGRHASADCGKIVMLAQPFELPGKSVRGNQVVAVDPANEFASRRFQAGIKRIGNSFSFGFNGTCPWIVGWKSARQILMSAVVIDQDQLQAREGLAQYALDGTG